MTDMLAVFDTIGCDLDILADWYEDRGEGDLAQGLRDIRGHGYRPARAVDNTFSWRTSSSGRDGWADTLPLRIYSRLTAGDELDWWGVHRRKYATRSAAYLDLAQALAAPEGDSAAVAQHARGGVNDGN